MVLFTVLCTNEEISHCHANSLIGSFICASHHRQVNEQKIITAPNVAGCNWFTSVGTDLYRSHVHVHGHAILD